MKKVYLVLTYTGTILSKIIKYYTKEEYAHVSISLDEDLEEMYSFGRLFPYIAFIGGFVHERINEGTFKRFKNTQAKICTIEVTDEQYEKLRELIYTFKTNKGLYRFNTIGLAGVVLKKKIKRKNYFYCAEFVKYALEETGITEDLPEIIRPQNFGEIKNIEICYKGRLKEYGLKKLQKLAQMNITSSAEI